MTRSSRLAAYFLNSNRPEGQSTWQWVRYWKRTGGLCHRAVSWGNLTAGCSLWPLECFLPSGCMVMVQEWSCQRRQITCAPPSTPSNNVRPSNYTGWPADKGQGKWLGHQIKPHQESRDISYKYSTLFFYNGIKKSTGRSNKQTYVPALLSHWVFEYWQKYGILMLPVHQRSKTQNIKPWN